ncbi:MAG: homocitrate synthase family protein [Methanomicrobiales archaeon]|nr:homocitrate synthase family protein [Methanomicrobiales archaeon]MDI6875887.1 homocitrate synthase family protein [Methanomicrobiales archaeon]
MQPWNVEICDVTLRDGEQTPGVSFRREEKMDIANLLDQIGVEVIEAGFPSVSKYETQCVKAIAAMGLSARTCCLARARRGDVDAAIDCDVDMVSVFIPSSELHVRHKFRKPRDQVLEEALAIVEYTRDHGIAVRFAAEDASRTDIPFLREMYRRGAEHGAEYLSFADTVGCLTPLQIHRVFAELSASVDGLLCAHCHNDMGLATANTLAAAEGGAYQLHTTVNGIGERAGNAALEEVLVALRMVGGIDRYDLSHLKNISTMVEQYSGIPVAKNKAVVGEFAFTHESGIHIAAILEDPLTYESIPPELVGAERRFVLGKHTGKKALEHVIQKLGYNLSEDEICWILEQVKLRSEHKCSVSPEMLQKLIRDAEGKCQP